MKSFQDTKTRVLVIGFGNPGRCDDGIGPALAERLQSLNLDGVRVESAYQLNVEDAELVAQHDVVLFADACLCADPPFTVRAVEPRAGTLEFTTHSQAPEGILGLAHDVFGATTKGFALGIRGYDFHDFGEKLSREASDNVDAAIAFVKEALELGEALWVPEPDSSGVGT